MGKLATLALKPYPCTLILKTLKRGMPDGVDGLTTLLDDGDIAVDIRDNLDALDKLLICVHEATHLV